MELSYQASQVVGVAGTMWNSGLRFRRSGNFEAVAGFEVVVTVDAIGIGVLL